MDAFRNSIKRFNLYIFVNPESIKDGQNKVTKNVCFCDTLSLGIWLYSMRIKSS